MKRKPRRKEKRRIGKSILRLPDLEVAKSAVLNSLSCPDAQRCCRHAIDEFVDWYCSEPRLSFSKTVVIRYRMHLESAILPQVRSISGLGPSGGLAYEASECGLYNDNGSLTYKISGVSVPYPVDQAITISPFDLVSVFLNYTIKDSSHLRGTKIQLAVNNLANSHNLVGVTPAVAATATVPYVQNPGDLLNLLPGRSITITIPGGYAPKR